MTEYENRFKNFIASIKLDDSPDHDHRDKLEEKLLCALGQNSRRKHSPLKIWRIIMKSRIAKLSAAAAVLIIIVTVSWLSSEPGSTQRISSFTLLARASAAEQALFSGTGGIAHIANEVVLYPGQERDVSELLSDLESEVTQDKNLAFIRSFLSHRWLPVYSLRADGQPREYKLELDKHTDKAVTVSDLAWYDAATGRFARVLKTGDKVLFANAFDGAYIYVARNGPAGQLQIEREQVTSTFEVPDNPADFLGIAAGIRGSTPTEEYPPIQKVTTETLEDGTPVRVYKMGFADPWGGVDTYYLFKISTEADVIAEIECVVEGRTTSIHRRLVAETVDQPAYSWNLAELSRGGAERASVNVDVDAGGEVVTVQQMVQRATSAVYIFAQDPSWTSDRVIYDEPDEMSPTGRLLATVYRANDGRDVVMCQGETISRYMTVAYDKWQELGEPVSWTYESENGFKAMHQKDKEGEMWWTEFALKSSGFEPAANRVGYILMSPAKTFLVLAINGPVSEQELNGLIDSLIPADQFGQ